jgi:hypothetical protein
VIEQHNQHRGAGRVGRGSGRGNGPRVRFQVGGDEEIRTEVEVMLRVEET